MLSVVSSSALQGIHALPVTVEVNAGEIGDPRMVMVGLPDAAVKESQDRVYAALQNIGFTPPRTRTTVNLAPGHIRKEGPMYDLPIALALVAATRQAQMPRLGDYLIAGELSLSGRCRPVRGALSMALLARELGKAGILLPVESAEEAALVESVGVYPVPSLDHALRFLGGEIEIERLRPEQSAFQRPPPAGEALDFADVKGQHAVRRAVEIAVAGGHNILMIGPPGSGKSMIAKRIPGIMPPPTLDEYLEILAVQSAAGATLAPEKRYFARPFRSPHHTISDVGLLGGGVVPGPGEVSLAHNGVLFLDELPEFRRSALEVLRQPLEDGDVTISRSAGKITLPASIMLVAAMNPTPSGYSTKDGRRNTASAQQIAKYRSRISGPLLDRVDIQVEAPALTVDELRNAKLGESSASIRERVIAARQRQRERFEGEAEEPSAPSPGDSTRAEAHGEERDAACGVSPVPKGARRVTACNARMSHAQIREHCQLTAQQGDLLQQAMERLRLSARAYDRILKVSRTIADLAGTARIETPHLLEAIQYRTLDRELFY